MAAALREGRAATRQSRPHHRATEAIDAYLAADGLDGISSLLLWRIGCWVQ